jgi:hypothetical protein
MRSPRFRVPGLLALGTAVGIAFSCHPGGIRNRIPNPVDGGFDASDANTGQVEVVSPCSPPCQSYQACIALRCTPRYVGTDLFDRWGVTVSWEIAVGPDGSLVVLGGFQGAVDFDPGPGIDLPTAEVGLFVTKWNPDGSYAWTRTAATRVGSGGKCAVAADGAVVVAFAIFGDAVFETAQGTRAFTSSEFGDWIVWKIAGDGSPSWIRSGTGGRIRDLALGADATVHLVGQVREEPQSFIVKLNEDGAPVWGHTMDQLTLSGVAVGSEGSVWAAGFSWGSIDIDPDPIRVDMLPSAGRDAVIWKLAPDGKHTLARSFCGQYNDYGHDVAVSQQGGVYLVGDGDRLLSGMGRGAQDAFVMKLDGEGRPSWLHLLGGESSDSAEQVVALPGGDVLVSGFSLSPDAVFDWQNTSDVRDLSAGRSFITRIGRDDRHLWTVALDAGARAATIAADSEGLLVLGHAFMGTFDFDPGTGSDIATFPEFASFLSRFRF